MSEVSPASSLSESFCLLEWVHTFPNSHMITTLADTSHSALIVEILKDLDPDLYKRLSSESVQGIDLAWQISRYLLKHIAGEVILTREYRIQQLVSKLLYISVHSTKKQQFIEKILGLDEGTQGVLMRLIEKIENEIIVVKDNRAILDKIADLEAANEELVGQLTSERTSHEKLKTLLEATKGEVKQLEGECERYRREKAETLRQLEIDQFSSYLSLYKKIQLQNQQFLNSVKRLEEKHEKLQQDNKQLKQKIIQDGVIISKYEEDYKEMRSTLKQLRSFKKKNQFFVNDDQLDDKFPGHSYSRIVKELEDHIVSEKEKYLKMIGESDGQMNVMRKENVDLRRMIKYLSGQIAQLQKVYKDVREHIVV